MQPDRWFGVASAEGTDAGARAAADALRRDDAKLLIVFCSQSQDLPGLLRQIRTQAGDVPLIGRTTAGEITAAGPSDGCVVVTALGGVAEPARADQVAAMASGAPIAGFYGYGEIARTRGVRGFHNQTLVVLSIA